MATYDDYDDVEGVRVLGDETSSDDDATADASGGGYSSVWSSGLPDWTEPPTGEVPRIRADGGMDVFEDVNTGSGPRWRQGSADWDDDAFDLDDGAERLGALSGLDEVEEFDLTPGRGQAAVRIETPAPARPARAPRAEYAAPAGGGDRDLRAATLVGLALIALVIGGTYLIGEKFAVLCIAALATAAQAELMAAMRHRGLRPAHLLVTVATPAVVGATYWRGGPGLLTVLVLTVIGCFLWQMQAQTRNATVNVAAGVFAFVYVGVFASTAALLLQGGRNWFVPVVVVVVIHDILGYFVGTSLGRTQMAPAVSPGKTWEGWAGSVAGVLLACLVMATAFHFVPLEGKHFLALFLIGVVVCPLGDLFESVIKRDLGIKDMGNVLPGHGGVLDRVDAMLLAFPCFYLVISALF
jgi:phosphatidate cytidylyltransferase